MNKAVNPYHWFSGRRSTDRPPQDDPADLGTAFGLDMSMDESAPAPVQPAPARPPGWVQRLAARRKPAA